MAAELDLRALSSFSTLPEPTISSLIDNPTSNLVKTLLQRIEGRIQESEQQKSQKLRLEIELETIVRTNESKVKAIQASRDNALAETSSLRTQVQQAEAARVQAESELENVKQTHSSDSSENATLKSRVESLESSRQDTLNLLESKSTAYDRLTQELAAERQKLVDTRKQVSTLEQSNQELSSAATTAKYKLNSLQQELDAQKRNSDWFEGELKKKSEDHQKFRKEKNAKVAELQQQNEQHIDEIEALRRTENSLKTRIEDQATSIESLQRDLQRAKESEITTADTHRIEIDELKRLAQLQADAADTAKRRVQKLEDERENAAEEIGLIRAEVQSEHEERLHAEQRIAELEAQVAQLQSEVTQAQSRPGTPRQDTNGFNLMTPMRAGTPSMAQTPLSNYRYKSGLSHAQLQAEYSRLEREMINLRRQNDELLVQSEEMTAELENYKPEIDQMRLDNSRMENEITEMSALVDQSNQQRDAVVKEARILQGQLDALKVQLNESQQSVRDRNRQVRWLLLQQRLEQAIDEDDYRRMEEAVRDADQDDLQLLSGMQREVSQHLIIFRNIEELQDTNAKQGELIRNLTERFESEEAQDRQQKMLEMEQSLNAAQQLVERYRDELKSHTAQIESYVKERDMLRNMIQRRNQLAPADFSKSMPIPAGGFNSSRGSPGPQNDYAKLLKDLQTEFDRYRDDQTSMLKSLRDQVSDLNQRSTHLQAENSRYVGQLSIANQSFEMAKSNYDTIKKEKEEIQKRCNAAQENSTQQELKTQQVAEELVEAKGQIDDLRRETTTLKAEKEWWKSAEKRLLDDNENIRNERARLSQLNIDMQNLLSEREHSDSETRRRLQSQVESLESELSSTKRRLEDEADENKRAAMRRENEREQSQLRIDDLISSLSTTREELASAKTTRDMLQAKVDEITVELRSAKERLEVVTRPSSAPTQETNGTNDSDLSKEQEQALEISELKKDLELTRAELERANNDIEEYKNIAQEAEERLNQFTETNDEDKASLQQELESREAKIKDLEQRVEDLSSELNDTITQLSQLRDERNEFDSKMEDLRSALNAEITQLKESEERAKDEAQANLDLVREQAKIAEENQQAYEESVRKHSDVLERLQSERKRANDLSLKIHEATVDAENAKKALEEGNVSWSDRESQYRQEAEKLKRDYAEATKQKNILHTMLEDLSKQVTTLQKDRAANVSAGANTEEDNTASTGNPDLSTLLEDIKYLRDQKEIVDIQYRRSEAEAKRLQSKLDLVESQLDEARLKLDKQRMADINLEANTLASNKLKEALNDLNLNRESNVTLRAELKHVQQTLEQRTSRIEELEIEITPLKARVTELEHLLELRSGEMDLLQKDRDSWQQRTQNILSKYDRVDPAELEDLKNKITALETERDEAVAKRDELQTTIDAHPKAIEDAKSDIRARLGEQFKTRNREQVGRLKEKQTELDTANEEKRQLQEELDSTKEQLETANSNLANHNSIAEAQAQVETTQAPASAPDSSEKIGQLEAKVEELEKAIAEKDAQIASMADKDEKSKAREIQMKEILNKRLAEVKRDAEAAKTAALEELRATLSAEHQDELEQLRRQSIPVSQEVQGLVENSEAPAPSENAKALENNDVEVPTEKGMTFDEFSAALTEAQAKALIKDNETISNILKSSIRKNIEKAREQLRAEFATAQPEASTEDITAQIAELEQKYAVEKEEIIRQKDEQYAAEKETMLQEHHAQIEAEKQYILEEQQAKLEQEVQSAKDKAEKLSAGKLKLITNQKDTAQAKVNVVKKAAEETPDKPVKEVWEVAKTAKPEAAKPVPAATPAAPVAPPTPIPTVAASEATDSETTVIEPNGVNPESAESTATTGSAPATLSSAPNLPAKPAAAQSGLRKPSAGIPRGQRGGRSGLPQPPVTHAQQQAQAQAQAGNSASIRGAASGIPSFKGNRGGNRAGNRGGADAGGRQSPALNAGAATFTPSGKRAREESGDGGNGSEKRAKGPGS